MGIDIDKLTPAPWSVEAARNAFTAQMEFGWHAQRINSGMREGGWRVMMPLGIDNEIEFGKHSANFFPDPVTALDFAYRWKKDRDSGLAK